MRTEKAARRLDNSRLILVETTHFPRCDFATDRRVPRRIRSVCTAKAALVICAAEGGLDVVNFPEKQQICRNLLTNRYLYLNTWKRFPVRFVGVTFGGPIQCRLQW